MTRLQGCLLGLVALAFCLAVNFVVFRWITNGVSRTISAIAEALP